jgi:hypothetical protein
VSWLILSVPKFLLRRHTDERKDKINLFLKKMAADMILFKLAATFSQTKYELSLCLSYSKLIDILKGLDHTTRHQGVMKHKPPIHNGGSPFSILTRLDF